MYRTPEELEIITQDGSYFKLFCSIGFYSFYIITFFNIIQLF